MAVIFQDSIRCSPWEISVSGGLCVVYRAAAIRPAVRSWLVRTAGVPLVTTLGVRTPECYWT